MEQHPDEGALTPVRMLWNTACLNVYVGNAREQSVCVCCNSLAHGPTYGQQDEFLRALRRFCVSW